MISIIVHDLVWVLGIIVSSIMFLSLFFYTRDGARYRVGCSVLAYVIMCMCVLNVVRIISEAIHSGGAAVRYDHYELFWQSLMCVMLVINKGNISFIVDEYANVNSLVDKCKKE